MLLSLVLVLNGATSAAAATHTQMNHDAAQTAIATAASQASVEDMPCHHHALASTTGAHDDPPIATDPAPGKSKNPAPDCCKSGTCRCACTHLAQATLPALNIAAPVLDGTRSVRRLILAHAAPALPHLIRPPIG
jgi:hypothetical protein